MEHQKKAGKFIPHSWSYSSMNSSIMLLSSILENKFAMEHQKRQNKLYHFHDHVHVHQWTQASCCCLQFWRNISSGINRMKDVSFLRYNMHPLPSAKLVLFELHTAFFQSKQSVILPYSNIIPRMKTSAPLTNNNVTRNNSLYPIHKD